LNEAGRARSPINQGVIEVQPRAEHKTPISIPNRHELHRPNELHRVLNRPPYSPIRPPHQRAVAHSPSKGLEEFAVKLASDMGHVEHWMLSHNNLYKLTIDMYQKLEKSEERCLLLEEDNNLLREQITTMTSTQEPIREEYWFILQFDHIGMEIESWVAKQTAATPAERIPKADREQLVRQISSWGEIGRNSAEFIQGQLKDPYRNRRKKIALIRHIIAIFLFDHVFDRFAFGMSAERSAYFKALETHIYHNGSFLRQTCP